jgi:hypothetical protein
MRVLLLLLAFLAAGPALAQSSSTQMPAGMVPPPRFLAKDLLGLCEGPENSARLAGCLRYLQGAVAMYELAVGEAKDFSLFCAPREAPPGQLRSQYVDWAKENADQLGQDAIQAVKLAMVDAFPCQGD